MSRTDRLMDLIQSLRRRRYAVSGRALSEELGVSLRTVYRDIATLQGQGAPIEGEAGVGFLLRPGYVLPPLMFTMEEAEALVLGVRWVVERGDDRLALGARDALAKIRAVVPSNLKDELESNTLLVPSQNRVPVDGRFVFAVRKAIRENKKMDIAYRDLKDQVSRRVVWPFALAYFDQVQIVVAWCEMRLDFRHFRADRVAAWTELDAEYPKRHEDLLKEWRATKGINPEKAEF